MVTLTAEEVADHCNQPMGVIEQWVRGGKLTLPITPTDFIRFLKTNNLSLNQFGKTVMLVNIDPSLAAALQAAVTDDDMSFLTTSNLISTTLMVAKNDDDDAQRVPLGNIIREAVMIANEKPDCIVVNMQTPRGSIEVLVQAMRTYRDLAKIPIVGLKGDMVGSAHSSLFKATYPITTPVMELITKIKALL